MNYVAACKITILGHSLSDPSKQNRMPANFLFGCFGAIWGITIIGHAPFDPQCTAVSLARDINRAIILQGYAWW